MTAADVSVVIPVRDGARYLGDALDSVWRQTAEPREVIVVDDGSDDSTPDVIRRHARAGLRVLRQTRAGAAIARNRGAAAAEGEFIAFLDADDLWTADKLALQIEAITQTPWADMVFGDIEEFCTRESGGSYGPVRRLPGYSAITLLIRRESFQRTGGFDGRWTVAEFIDWHARATELGLKSVMLPRILALRRIHPGNRGRLQRVDAVQYARVLKAALDRRRTENPIAVAALLRKSPLQGDRAT